MRISAIIVSGGSTPDYHDGNSVEILRSDGTPWCSLPELPFDSQGISSHTQSGLIACGGSSNNRQSCVTFKDGVWTTSHSLREDRWEHSAWASPAGVVLLGGANSDPSTSSELLSDSTGTSSVYFPLKYAVT